MLKIEHLTKIYGNKKAVDDLKAQIEALKADEEKDKTEETAKNE